MSQLNFQVLSMMRPYQELVDAMRGVFPTLVGTEAQIAQLIADALESLDPESEQALDDARSLNAAFVYIATTWGGVTTYPEDIDETEEE